jgi:hypothetical protein
MIARGVTRGDLLSRIRSAGTPWAAVVALLEYSRARPRWHRLAHDLADHQAPWSRLENEVVRYFEERLPTTLLLTPEDRRQIENWLGPELDFDRAHAIAWGIDEAAFPTFSRAWRDGLTLVDGCYQLRRGDAYPLGYLDSADVAGAELATLPHAATDAAKHELPHVRFFAKPESKWAERVVLDFRLWDRLETLLSNLSEVATIHPNEDIAEWLVPESSGIFPVTLCSPVEQVERYRRLLSRVRDTDFKANLVVAPELAATDETIAAIQVDLDRDEHHDAMIVAGSQHLVEQGRPVNRAFALLPDRAPIVHDKLVPMRRRMFRQPERMEGITSDSTLRIYQAGRFRFALLICKDILDAHMVRLLIRMNVNVIAVPAMSPKTRRFRSVAEQLVDEAQAVVVVANGPYRWGSRTASPSAVFSQPVESAPVTTASPEGECCTGCAWHKIGGGEARWLSVRF